LFHTIALLLSYCARCVLYGNLLRLCSTALKTVTQLVHNCYTFDSQLFPDCGH